MILIYINIYGFVYILCKLKLNYMVTITH